MFHYSLLLLGTLCIFFKPTAGMTCNEGGGRLMTCPNLLDPVENSFCCEGKEKYMNYCCGFEEYVRTNSAIVAAIVISTVVFALIIIICCCCFCSCCYLAQRRVAGRVIYVNTQGPVSSISPPAYQQLHPPPGSQAYNQPLHNITYTTGQDPINSHYKY